jgi:tetratricopeptide (TPR) repeat protein
MGLVYFQENDFKDAIGPLASVVSDQPASSQARYLLGLCYFFTGKPNEAVDMLDPLWTQQSGQLSYLYVLGNAAGAANRKDIEQRALSRLVEIGSNSAEFHLFMGKGHLNREEYDEAVSELKTAAQLNPNLPFVHFNLGLAYLQREDYPEAKAELLKDIVLEPDAVFNYDRLGTVCWHLRQNAAAEQNFRKALRLDPRLASSLFGLAQVLNDEGKYSAALSELDIALKIDPDNNSLHYLRGRILLRLNRKQEAQTELAAATRLLQSQRENRQKELYGNLPHPELTTIPQ